MRCLEAEDSLRIFEGNLFPLHLGHGCRRDERYRRTRGLIGVVNRPHDVIGADFVDAVLKRQRIFDTARGDRM